MKEENEAFQAMRKVLEAYAPLSEKTWLALVNICKYRALRKHEILYQTGDLLESYAFVYLGLIRCYVCDENGSEYNKMFFDEDTFPGSMTALLTSAPSKLSFEALENSLIIEINFSAYRKLLLEMNDLRLFQIYYLEKNWLLAKDAREIEIVQENATARYLRFIAEKPGLVERLPQYHIASHLGITPTQLSRIRKNI